MSVKGRPDVHNTACMHDCETAVEITSQLPAGFVERLYGDLSADFRGLAAPPAAPPSTGSQVAALQPCLACHAVDHRIVGPAFREVAEKYKGAASAQEMLVGKLKSGGVGAWGTVPMPPQPQLSDDEAQTLVRWILSGAPNSPAP
jgi:cytochrome c